MIFVEASALKNCVNRMASYGEICVGCNCCGRFYDDKGASLTAKQKEERVENWWKKNEVEE
ncbi:MAG: hypothetical protein RR348_06490 [Clostridia bacterium]